LYKTHRVVPLRRKDFVVATQYYDNEPSIVDELFDEAFQEAQQVIFSGKDYIGFLPAIGKSYVFELINKWDGLSNTFQPTKSKLLDDWNCKKPLRSGFHSLANRYFAKLKKKYSAKEKPKAVQLDLLKTADAPEPAIYEPWEKIEDSDAWEVWFCRRTKEIHLYHRRTMTRSESNYHSKGFNLGSVSVEDQPCINTNHIELHRQKCSETAYRVLSGR
jgi:hypothetical protein